MNRIERGEFSYLLVKFSESQYYSQTLDFEIFFHFLETIFKKTPFLIFSSPNEEGKLFRVENLEIWLKEHPWILSRIGKTLEFLWLKLSIGTNIQQLSRLTHLFQEFSSISNFLFQKNALNWIIHKKLSNIKEDYKANIHLNALFETWKSETLQIEQFLLTNQKNNLFIFLKGQIFMKENLFDLISPLLFLSSQSLLNFLIETSLLKIINTYLNNNILCIQTLFESISYYSLISNNIDPFIEFLANEMLPLIEISCIEKSVSLCPNESNKQGLAGLIKNSLLPKFLSLITSLVFTTKSFPQTKERTNIIISCLIKLGEKLIQISNAILFPPSTLEFFVSSVELGYDLDQMTCFLEHLFDQICEKFPDKEVMKIFCESLDLILIMVNSDLPLEYFRLIFSIFNCFEKLGSNSISILLNLIALAGLNLTTQSVSPEQFFSLYEFTIVNMLDPFIKLKSDFPSLDRNFFDQNLLKFLKLAFDLCHYIDYIIVFNQILYLIPSNLTSIPISPVDMLQILSLCIDVSNSIMKIVEFGVSGFIYHLNMFFQIWILNEENKLISLSDLEKTLQRAKEKFLQDGSYSSLFDLQKSYLFFEKQYGKNNIKYFFKTVYRMENREIIRMLDHLTNADSSLFDLNFNRLIQLILKLDSPDYTSLRKTPFSHSEHLKVLYCIKSISHLEKPPQIKFVTTKMKYLLFDLEKSILESAFNAQTLSFIINEVSHYLFLKVLTQYEFSQNTNSTTSLLTLETPNFQIPDDIKKDSYVLQSLYIITRRIHHLQQQKPPERRVTYCNLLKIILPQILSIVYSFLQTTVPSSYKSSSEKIDYRKKWIQGQILNLPANIRLKTRLVSLGYDEELFKRNIYNLIKLNEESSGNIEEDSKEALLDIYSGYLEIFHVLRIQEMMDDRFVTPMNVQDIFSKDFSVDHLKTQRTRVVQFLRRILLKNRDSNLHLLNHISLLLQKESALEEKLENQTNTLQEETPDGKIKRGLIARYGNNFFTVNNCCSNKIVGCYAPDGFHAEKTLENSLKVNASFISIFEENLSRFNHSILQNLENEIENAEVLLTDQGLFVFGVYTNGHVLDTSSVWISFLKNLVEYQYVPAIIIPQNWNHRRAVNLIRQKIPAQEEKGMITFQDDFFDNELKSYYDFIPTFIEPGDFVLNSQNVHLLEIPNIHSHEAGSNSLLEAASSLDKEIVSEKANKKAKSKDKDLSNTLSIQVIKILKEEHPSLDPLINALGKSLLTCIQNYLASNEIDQQILQSVLRVQRGKIQLSEIEQTNLIQSSIKTLKEVLQNNYYLLSIHQLKDLLLQHEPLFFQLRNHLLHLEKSKLTSNQETCLKLLNKILLDSLSYSRISDLIPIKQEEVMRWIFKNEDKIWRTRGGIQESLEDMLEMLKKNPFPGIVVYSSRNKIIAYVLGDVNLGPGIYELAMAWCHESYRNLGLTTRLYLACILEIYFHHQCKFLVFDVVEGTFDKLLKMSFVFRILYFLLRKRVIQGRNKSYTNLTLEEKVENFEQFQWYLPPFVWAIRILNWIPISIPYVTQSISFRKEETKVQTILNSSQEIQTNSRNWKKTGGRIFLFGTIMVITIIWRRKIKKY